MTPVLTQAEFRNCFKCNYQAETSETHCPKCRKVLHSERDIRILGGLLAFLGTLIAGGMCAVMIWMQSVIANTNPYSSKQGWSGSPEETSAAFAVVGLVMFFGFSALITGLYMLCTGRRNLTLLWGTLVIGAVLYGVAVLVPQIY